MTVSEADRLFNKAWNTALEQAALQLQRKADKLRGQDPAIWGIQTAKLMAKIFEDEAAEILAMREVLD